MAKVLGLVDVGAAVAETSIDGFLGGGGGEAIGQYRIRLKTIVPPDPDPYGDGFYQVRMRHFDGMQTIVTTFALTTSVGAYLEQGRQIWFDLSGPLTYEVIETTPGRPFDLDLQVKLD